MEPYLDPINQTFVDASIKAGGPPLESLSYITARAAFEHLQKHIPAGDVSREVVEVPAGPQGTIKTYFFKPLGTTEDLSMVFYFHGGGWILGNPDTHDSLVRDLAKFPTQFEEVCGVIDYLVNNRKQYGLKTKKIGFAGDSVGGHMAIGMSTLAAQRKLPTQIAYQVLFYPVTTTCFESSSYTTYADGPHLTVSLLRWMYAAFFNDGPISPDSARATILGSPLLFAMEEARLQPPTLIILASVDPLVEEGRAFGRVLQEAGVECSVLTAEGVIHDFVMLEGTRRCTPAKTVVELAGLKLRGGASVGRNWTAQDSGF